MSAEGVKAIVLLGAPGAGKGTMAEAIKSAKPITHIATGDMLREEIKQGSKLGTEAEEWMQQGKLVPDELIVRMVTERVDRGTTAARYMFDGFPRTLAQAELLADAFKSRQATLALVLLLEVTPALCRDRLTGRRVCRQCSANYHIRNIPPRVEGICDKCGGELYQRSDDMPETIDKRLEVFQAQTTDLIEYYTRQGIIARLDSARPREETVAKIMQLLNKHGF